MRSLYEKLNSLDDSLVESKRIVKKNKLTESTEKTTIEVKFEPYTRYGYEPVKTARISGKNLLDALLNMSDRMHLYVNSDYADDYEDDYGVKLTAETFLERIEEENGDGCDFIFYIKNLTTGEMLFDSGYEESEDWDDDIDEMLTEAELTDREKLMKTFPDDFGHWGTRPANKTPAQHKTMNDYARDPNTPTYDNKEVITKPEMSARDKLLKTFPDLDIRSSKDFLKEEVRDTDYVIALYHGAGRYTFFTERDTMTSDINKAATYRNKMMAESDIKYAVDASQRYGTPSDDPLYEDRFSVMTVADFKNNPSVKTEYKPVDNEVLTQQKKDQEALAQFIANISKKYNISTNSICTKAKQDADELLRR